MAVTHRGPLTSIGAPVTPQHEWSARPPEEGQGDGGGEGQLRPVGQAQLLLVAEGEEPAGPVVGGLVGPRGNRHQDQQDQPPGHPGWCSRWKPDLKLVVREFLGAE